MPGELDGRCAVVTGAASGIGREIASTFADEGAAVVVTDIRTDPREGGLPTHEVIEEDGGEAVFVECDVRDGDRASMFDAADDFGGVDVLVNNAGVLIRKPFTAFTEADYDRIMDVNVKGPFFLAQRAAERMQANGGGSIINLSSVSGLLGSAETAAYCASKGAIKLLTYALADELGPEIRVNAIHPGAVETMQAKQDSRVIGSPESAARLEKIPAGRFGRPEDVAGMAVYLASDRASYVTGASMVVDGGDSNTR